MSGNVEIVTFGWRLNAYESEVIRKRAVEDGLSNAITFNTCAVTNEAVRQARQAIRKARRERPDAKLIVTGCAAQIAPATFAAMSQVDLVQGNAEKSAAGAYSAAAPEARVRVNDIMSVRETAGHLIDGLKDRARPPARRLRAAGDLALDRHLARQVGWVVTGLVERNGVARAEDFTEIAFSGEGAGGSIIPIAITGYEGTKALGKAAAPAD